MTSPNPMNVRRLGVRLDGSLERNSSHCKVVGSVPFTVFRTQFIHQSPMDLEKAAKKASRSKNLSLTLDNDDVEVLREEVQREFVGARVQNVQSFSEYIERRALSAQPYSLPPQSLYTPDSVLVRLINVEKGGYIEEEPEGEGSLGLCTCWFMPGSVIINTDAETQCAALFETYKRLSSQSHEAMRAGDPHELERLKSLKQRLDVLAITVELHFEAQLSWAKHSFWVRNRKGIKHSGLSINNSDDPMISVVNSILQRFPTLKASLHPKARQATDEHPLTLGSLSQYVACLCLGLGGLQKGKIPDDMDPDELDGLRQKALDWTETLATTLGDHLTSRNSVASTPQVLAALGAMGHAVLYEKTQGNPLSLSAAIQRLSQIDWTKGQRWIGVALKLTTEGQFSQAGGAKEWTSRIYSALVTPSHPLYGQITRSSAATAPVLMPTLASPSTSANDPSLP
ncbi:hypothetical protein [Cystobacter fuscus]|uniref:hypothetical protein n=1 Tax=Cystobacter fuscus TaxID=43 RepID=UPI002B2BA611|nr:hypothetical protein F0U63_46100 [Cystobacter fuscus]